MKQKMALSRKLSLAARVTVIVFLVALGVPARAEDYTSTGSAALQESWPSDAPIEVDATPTLSDLGSAYQKLEIGKWVPSASPYSIDLLSALALAGAKDLEIQAMKQRLREALSDQQMASVRRLPHLSLFSEFNKHEGLIQGTVGDLPRASKQSLFSGVGLTWVYDFSQERFDRLATCQVSQAWQAELAATHDHQLFQSASSYYDVVGALAAIHVARESLRRGEALLEHERTLLSRGKGLEAEVARAAAFRAAQAQSLSQAMAAKEIASVGMAIQLRLDPLVPLQPVEEAVVPVRLVDSRLSRQELITTALNKRPELREAGWLLAAAGTRQSGAALKPYLPVLAGEAKIGAFGGDAGSNLQEFDDRQDYRLSLQWTADHLGKGDQARLAREAARTGEAQVRRQLISDQIVKEVLEAWANACSAEERMELARAQVEAANVALSRSESRLRSGVAIPYKVIQSQEDLVRAETNHIRSIIEYNRAELDLLRSLGGLGSLL